MENENACIDYTDLAFDMIKALNNINENLKE
jgi:hypothetical protein